MVFLKIKVDACILIHPISIYKKFGRIILKYPILLILLKNFFQKNCNSNNALKITLPARR